MKVVGVDVPRRGGVGRHRQPPVPAEPVRGLVSLVAVLTSLYPGATVARARVVVKERPSVHQIIGLSLALAGMASIAAG